MIRNFEDTDGVCFADIAAGSGCRILSAVSAGCGTYGCPFYKPIGCRDWIRLTDAHIVRILTPEEYSAERRIR